MANIKFYLSGKKNSSIPSSVVLKAISTSFFIISSIQYYPNFIFIRYTAGWISEHCKFFIFISTKYSAKNLAKNIFDQSSFCEKLFYYLFLRLVTRLYIILKTIFFVFRWNSFEWKPQEWRWLNKILFLMIFSTYSYIKQKSSSQQLLFGIFFFAMFSLHNPFFFYKKFTSWKNCGESFIS